MPDEILKIRQVRLCQCGKLAGHDSVCQPGQLSAAQRVDRAWDEQNAVRRGERYAKRRESFDENWRRDLAAMDALELVRSAFEQASTISTVPAGSVEPSRGGSERAGPPVQSMLSDDPRWQETWAVIKARAIRAHELIREAKGLGTLAATTTMLGAEKDKRVLAEEELSPVAVVEKLGREIAGSPETVRRIRKAAGRSALNGRRLPVDS